MKQGFKSEHWKDTNGNPAGGVSYGVGFAVSWQHGPLGRDADRIQPNGAFVEDLLGVVMDRIEYYQDSRFNCKENAEALHHLQMAAEFLDSRTQNREARQVEGTHQE